MATESVINIAGLKKNTPSKNTVAVDDPDLSLPFIREVISQMRVQDYHGAWDRKDDAGLISPFIIPRAQRRQMPIIADPDERTLFRIEVFYASVGMAIEKRTGVMSMPMMKLHQEGFGRLMLVAGRLVLISRIMRDAHRFGFDNLEKMAAEGDKLIEDGVKMINEFPEVARYDN